MVKFLSFLIVTITLSTFGQDLLPSYDLISNITQVYDKNKVFGLVSMKNQKIEINQLQVLTFKTHSETEYSKNWKENSFDDKSIFHYQKTSVNCIISNIKIGGYLYIQKDFLNVNWRLSRLEKQVWIPIDSGNIYKFVPNNNVQTKSGSFYADLMSQQLEQLIHCSTEYKLELVVNLGYSNTIVQPFTFLEEQSLKQALKDSVVNSDKEVLEQQEKVKKQKEKEAEEEIFKEERENQEKKEELKLEYYNPKVYICESVTDKGMPIGESKVFSMNPLEGKVLYFLVRLENPLDCDTLEFDIVNTSAANHFVEQYEKVGLYSKKWFYFDLHILLAGKYIFDVTDCSKNSLLIYKTIFTIF